MSRKKRIIGWGALAAALVGLAVWSAAMPGRSYPAEEVSVEEDEVQALADALREDVEALAGRIGERNVFRPDALDEAVEFLEAELEDAGLDPVRRSFHVRSVECHNVEVELAGSERPDQIVVIGAHYDSVIGSPGANDNGSGVAALLALVRSFADRNPARTLRFVFFVNEEPPFFMTEEMGSRVYAAEAAEAGETIHAMVSLETIGYYANEPGSQEYPVPPLRWLYPSEGNFIGFVGNLRSRSLLRRALGEFRDGARIPSEGAALPSFVPGVGWSDHWSFWQEGFPAIMITDTAPFRYPYYHTEADTPDKLDYGRMALVVQGLEDVVSDLAGA